MTKDEILEKFKEYFYDEVGSSNSIKEHVYNSIHYDANLKRDLKADELDLWEFFIRLEEELDIAISDEEREGFCTVGHFVDFIYERQRQSTR